jgi:hypothetical protein
MAIAPKYRVGRVFRQIRRCLIANARRPVAKRTLVTSILFPVTRLGAARE